MLKMCCNCTNPWHSSLHDYFLKHLACLLDAITFPISHFANFLTSHVFFAGLFSNYFLFFQCQCNYSWHFYESTNNVLEVFSCMCFVNQNFSLINCLVGSFAMTQTLYSSSCLQTFQIFCILDTSPSPPLFLFFPLYLHLCFYLF